MKRAVSEPSNSDPRRRDLQVALGGLLVCLGGGGLAAVLTHVFVGVFVTLLLAGVVLWIDAGRART